MGGLRKDSGLRKYKDDSVQDDCMLNGMLETVEGLIQAEVQGGKTRFISITHSLQGVIVLARQPLHLVEA